MLSKYFCEKKQYDITLILKYIKEHTDSTYPQVGYAAKKQSKVQKSGKNISNKKRERVTEPDIETERKTVTLTQRQTE